MEDKQKTLTARELEVTQLLVKGDSRKMIADNLRIDITTVDTHIKHIHLKLGISSNAGVSKWWYEVYLRKK